MLKHLLSQFNLKKIIPVICLAIVFSIINVLHIIIGIAKTTVSYKYLATGHYYLDYFYYLVPITEGQNGKWLFENYYSHDELFKTILGPWQYLIYGKIGKLFHLDPIATYWFFVVTLGIIACLFLYILIDKLIKNQSLLVKISALIITISAAPFFKIEKWIEGIKIIPFGFWNDRATLFQRIGVIPHHTMALICTIIILLLYTDFLENHIYYSVKRKLLQTAIILLLVFFVLTFTPYQAVLLVATFILSGLIIFVKKIKNRNKQQIVDYFIWWSILIFGILTLGLLIKGEYQKLDFFIRLSKTEINWQIYPKIIDLLLVIGPVILFVPFGIKKYWGKMTAIKGVFLIYIIIGLIFFYSPLALYLGTTNSRFLNPLNYILYAVLAVLGMKAISQKAKKHSNTIFIGLFILLIIVFIPGNLNNFTNTMKDNNIFSSLTYLPQPIIKGFDMLKTYSRDKVVLTSPSMMIGSLVPIFSNKRVYIGRYFPTPNYQEKAYLADRFYLGQMSSKEGFGFLYQNNIDYVILTSLEAYSKETISNYPFLKLIYKNPKILIWQFQKKS